MKREINFYWSELFISSFLRNLFPANLVAAAFRSVSASTPTSPQHIFSSMTRFMDTFCLFSLPPTVLCGLFIMIYFTNHAEATPCSFAAAVNAGCSAESLIMPLNEENGDRLLFPSRPNASFSCPLPAVTMAKPFHSSQPSNTPRLAAFERSTS